MLTEQADGSWGWLPALKLPQFIANVVGILVNLIPECRLNTQVPRKALKSNWLDSHRPSCGKCSSEVMDALKVAISVADRDCRSGVGVGSRGLRRRDRLFVSGHWRREPSTRFAGRTGDPLGSETLIDQRRGSFDLAR